MSSRAPSPIRVRTVATPTNPSLHLDSSSDYYSPPVDQTGSHSMRAFRSEPIDQATVHGAASIGVDLWNGAGASSFFKRYSRHLVAKYDESMRTRLTKGSFIGWRAAPTDPFLRFKVTRVERDPYDGYLVYDLTRADVNGHAEDWTKSRILNQYRLKPEEYGTVWKLEDNNIVTGPFGLSRISDPHTDNDDDHWSGLSVRRPGWDSGAWP